MATLLASAVAAVSIGLALSAAIFLSEGLGSIVYALGWVGFTLVGSLLIARRPGNPIGWIFAVIGLVAELGMVAESERSAVELARLLPAAVVATLGGLWFVSFILLPALLIVFPTGRPPSARWGLVLIAIALVLPIGTLTSGADPARAAIGPLFTAVLGPELGAQIVGELQGLASLAMLGFFVLGAVALRSRFARSRGVEREQLKWFVFAGALVASVMVLTLVAFFSPLRALDPEAPFPVAMFSGIPFVAALLTVPLAAAIAILRYRLYDIDVLINRALVYGALTATLGAAYVGSVLALQAVLRPFTADNEIAVAVSTLAVVALFQPLRRRIQDAVDRRFYRSRYDAARTLDAFAARLRDEVDLDHLRSDLLDVVGDTVRPAHASVWLRRSG